MPDSTNSIEAKLAALAAEVRATLAERDARYTIQFLTLRDAAELNNKAVQIAMEAAEKAIIKAEHAVDKRFESVNEFRGQMADMQTSLARTDLVNARFAGVEKKLDDVYEFKTGSQAKSQGYSDFWGWVIGAVGVLIATGAFFFKGG